MARTPEQIKHDLIAGLSAAKREIVSIKLADLRAVVPGRDDLLDCLGGEYETDWIFDPVPDSLKIVKDAAGRRHRLETVRNVAVQREKLLQLLQADEA